MAFKKFNKAEKFEPVKKEDLDKPSADKPKLSSVKTTQG